MTRPLFAITALLLILSGCQSRPAEESSVTTPTTPTTTSARGQDAPPLTKAPRAIATH